MKDIIDNELVVAYAGTVAETLLYKARFRKGLPSSLDEDVTAILKATKMMTAMDKRLRTDEDEFISDQTKISFLAALHPDRNVERRIVERTFRELSHRTSQRLIKTLTPELLAKGRLSRDELKLIWNTFNGKAAKVPAA